MSHKANRRGMTFVEVMISIVIFSLGIAAIFKVFLVSLDRGEYLTNRLYAVNLLDNRVEKISRILKAYKALPVELDETKTITPKAKAINFKQGMQISEIEGFSDIFKIDLSVNWQQKDREIKLKRSAYLSEF